MTEAQLEECIRIECERLGIYRFHVYDPRRSERGWPDDTLIGRRGVIFRELKSATGVVTRAQRLVGYLLEAAGEDWDVWRPADWPNRIVRELEQIR